MGDEIDLSTNRFAGDNIHNSDIEPDAERSFPKSIRIRSKEGFDRAYALRQVASDDCLVVFGYPNGLPHSRLGMAVSRKVGGAVLRNRWKRLIREAFRLNCRDLPPGVDLVVLPRKGAEPDFHRIERSLRRLAQRAARRVERLRGAIR